MDQGSYQTIKVDREDRVLTLTLNRPEQLNAVNGLMHEELSRVFSDAARDPDSDVIVLTGSGRAFCAGGDIDWMQEAIDDHLAGVLDEPGDVYASEPEMIGVMEGVPPQRGYGLTLPPVVSWEESLQPTLR